MDRRAANSPGRLIMLGGRPVEYRFRRSRRRTLGITVDARGLAVAAPLRAPFREVEAFLLEKEPWILAKLAEWASVPEPAVLQGVSGESLPLFGSRVTLETRHGRRAVRPEGERLVVVAPRPSRVTAVLVSWLKACALESLEPRVRHYAGRLGLGSPQVALSRARTQWGVCVEGGTIRLNWRLVHVEPALADYVVAHEVAHLVELNHSKRFWSLVSRLYPDWRAARERLERAGASLPIIRSPA